MRLINAKTLKFEEFFDSIPQYTILSHTWGNAEVTFQEFANSICPPGSAERSESDERRRRQMAARRGGPGVNKILNCVGQTLRDGFEFCWIDTCCIDKRSSAELSEAINSMFQWYKDAEICYIFLSDFSMTSESSTNVDKFELLGESRWFTRGWTLQELLAPAKRDFFDLNWTLIGSINRDSNADSLHAGFQLSHMAVDNGGFAHHISNITGISLKALYSLVFVEECCIAEKMSWAATRTTCRAEDVAYCLLGLFDINMPLLYGEGGEKAFVRLQEEILKHSVDRTIFAWEDSSAQQNTFQGLLAKSPACFGGRDRVRRYHAFSNITEYDSSVVITNRGISMNLPLMQIEGVINEYLACLRCGVGNSHCFIRLTWLGEGNQFARLCPETLLVEECELSHAFEGSTKVYIQQNITVPKGYQSHRISAFAFADAALTNVLSSNFWNPKTRCIELTPQIQQSPAPKRTIEIVIKSDDSLLEDWGSFKLFIELDSSLRSGCEYRLESEDADTTDNGKCLSKGDVVLSVGRSTKLFRGKLVQILSLDSDYV